MYLRINDVGHSRSSYTVPLDYQRLVMEAKRICLLLILDHTGLGNHTSLTSNRTMTQAWTVIAIVSHMLYSYLDMPRWGYSIFL